MRDLPDCRSIVIPVGGGGLLMGLAAYLSRQSLPVKLVGCEPYNYPKYAPFSHERSRTIADGLLVETPHAIVQERIKSMGLTIGLVHEADIRTAVRRLFFEQALVVEPSSAIAVAFAEANADDLEGPICVVLTGGNIARQDFERLIDECAKPPSELR
jgi:threonine dehydratase